MSARRLSVVNDFHGLFETNGNEDAKDLVPKSRIAAS
jgi:hypothetical protein